MVEIDHAFVSDFRSCFSHDLVTRDFPAGVEIHALGRMHLSCEGKCEVGAFLAPGLSKGQGGIGVLFGPLQRVYQGSLVHSRYQEQKQKQKQRQKQTQSYILRDCSMVV